MAAQKFVHLHLHSPYSFLDGASSTEQLLQTAADLDMPALAITDHNNLCGAVEFNRLAEAYGIKPITGAEITLENGHHLVLLAKNPAGYRNLCHILTESHLGSPRLEPKTPFSGLRKYSSGLFALSGCRKGEIPYLILAGDYRQALESAKNYISIFGRNNFYLELQGEKLPGNRHLNNCLLELSAKTKTGCVITNNVHYARKQDFPVHDILTCVRTNTKLEEVHPERRLNGENYLKSAAEMLQTVQTGHTLQAGQLARAMRTAQATQTFQATRKGQRELQYDKGISASAEVIKAAENTLIIAEACSPAFTKGTHFFPRFAVPGGETAASLLRKLTYAGARLNYKPIDSKVTSRLEHELKIIIEMGFADYFLMVWDIANYARENKIRFAGRGSAADSAVAYCLHITEVDAIARGLLFERFLSPERAQCPDIDLDIDSRFRDQVADYVQNKYGAEHTAHVCTFNTFKARSAWRDLGKAMGFPPEELDSIAKLLPHVHADHIRPAAEKYPELRNSPILSPRYSQLLDLCQQVAGFPRFIGTHLGGVVVSSTPLADIAPLQTAAKGVTVIQLDKEFVEDAGLIKLDLISLRTMSAIEDTVQEIKLKDPGFDYYRIPMDDKKTYELLGSGETYGIFQLESPAQRALQARLGPSTIEDVIASVALIRPGPLKGNMVEPYLARRHGKEPVTYLHPKLKPILEKTYGVVLYQEQVIEIATAVAGFTPGEADRLRRVMTHARSQKEMETIGKEFIAKAKLQGLSPEIAHTIYSYIQGYASYGFCEAHAAAFGTTAYKTAYLMTHYPAEYFAALLSHQPMGYYPPNTLCQEARRRGIAILLPDINLSGANFKVSKGAIRISLKQVHGMSREALAAILKAREKGPFLSLMDFCNRVRVKKDILHSLILCGAFDSLNPNRRQLIWQAAGQLKKETSLERLGKGEKCCRTYLGVPDFSPREKQRHEYSLLGIDVHQHYMAQWRSLLKNNGILSSAEIKAKSSNTLVTAAGTVLRPHRPPTRSGRTVVFFSLEDEFGLVDVTVFENVYQLYGHLIFCNPSPPLVIKGKIKRERRNLSIIATKIEAFGQFLAERETPY